MSTQLQALELWRNTLVASVRGDAPDLSARQMALLLCVYLGEGPHTVRGLAKDLKISKPAVSRALDRLGELSYIRRERDELDRRNVLVRQTPGGAKFLTDYAALISAAEEFAATIDAQKPLIFALEAVTAAANAIAAPKTPPPRNGATLRPNQLFYPFPRVKLCYIRRHDRTIRTRPAHERVPA